MSEIDKLVDQLSSTKVEDKSEKVVSFVGQGLSLDTEEDAGVIVEAIKNCPCMTTLKLEGNTIGTPAAKAIAEALKSQSNFNKALWKDMFTRRDKDEIPKALNYLSNGIMTANARLVVLDLSDNAFGPRGLNGLQELLQSPSCYTLQELYLNNNGLGITGSTMLSKCLCSCLENSRKNGTPMTLKVFVCGRNRLENDGAIAVSKFLKDLGTLEYVAMPQNGIYAPGIKKLAEAFASNPNLNVINLNDNSLTEDGAKYIANCLSSLKKLQVLNLGDCLVRTRGAMSLAEMLLKNCPDLKEFNLGYNELDKEAGLAVIDAISDKESMDTLVLNGNQFGNEGCQLIEEKMTELDKIDMLSSLSDDEGDDDDEEDEDYDDEEYEPGENEDDETDSEEEVEILEDKKSNQKSFQSPMLKNISPADFLALPSSEGLVSLSKSNQDLKTVLPPNSTLDDYLSLFMKIAKVLNPENTAAKEAACKYADEILSLAIKSVDIVEFNNSLVVHLGLLKGEDKKPQQGLDISGALAILEHAVRQSYFHASTRDSLQFFLSRPLTYAKSSDKTKHSLMQALYQM